MGDTLAAFVARNRGKRLRLDTGELPENFGTPSAYHGFTLEGIATLPPNLPPRPLRVPLGPSRIGPGVVPFLSHDLTPNS
jgi:hypothetical protein